MLIQSFADGGDKADTGDPDLATRVHFLKS
jgi:hypothetical protein